jgi:hypothetical protein
MLDSFNHCGSHSQYKNLVNQISIAIGRRRGKKGNQKYYGEFTFIIQSSDSYPYIF